MAIGAPFLSATGPAGSKANPLKHMLETSALRATATLTDEILTLSTGAIERRYAWRNGHLATLSVSSPDDPRPWTFPGQRPDLVLPGEAFESSDGELQIVEAAATKALAAHLLVKVTCRLGGLELRREFRLYDDVPAIACDLFVRGTPASSSWRGEMPEMGLFRQVEQVDPDGYYAPVVERWRLDRQHTQLELTRFYDRTDRRNNLVQTESLVPYRAATAHVGNLLVGHCVLTGRAFFLLKEAPCSDVQLAWPEADFTISVNELTMLGLGVDPSQVKPDEWTRCYGFVSGVAPGSTDDALVALRQYQQARRTWLDERDCMVMANTWGDRSQDARVSEEFTCDELRAGRRLGISHFQIDDGWQTGRSGASAVAQGSLEGIWDRSGYWDVWTERFPNGLEPVVKLGREVGIDVGLWFNPSRDDSYAHWADDAETLLRLNREYGVRVFKIDGVDIPDRAADTNLRRMFDTVLEATGDEVTFNLDVTSGRRFGYHYFNEYGTIFLENRYSDHHSYYPHWTLRNLWQLSSYVPPRLLQIECLNRWRNADQYVEGDPLAPQRVPFEYCFAVTMAAQPLCWFEVSSLPEKAFELAPVVATYREHQTRLHRAVTLPIGEEPSGASWTGFQADLGDEGYLLVYREVNDRPTARLTLRGLAGRRLSCTRILGAGHAFDSTVDADGRLEFALPEPLSYGLWAYRVSD